ncbi:hypothetical protein [Actinomadura decatromicini]|uniref:Uncharacterized protein n=1 Tax=Actinomadura decatromicini TaxID=2604572 RepID=A0A5D3FBF1_9ACTN|nr:hypothetical protein [Actinomadura decatromicini]TYK45214.1 hypothetical protein FXF68_31550 [Actinomadura decatromicini]
MSIRIPTRVNKALDAAERHQWAAVAAVIAYAVTVLVVAVIVGHLTAGFTAMALGAMAFIVLHDRAREARLREQLRQRDYDLAAERREIERLRAGDPSAPTAQLRPIGESGEAT